MTLLNRRQATARASASLLLIIFFTGSALGQNWRNIDGDVRGGNHSMFRPIDSWPDPTRVRNAAGAPGVQYWQQRADYVIETRLDTVKHAVSGSETITYHNNSPDVLTFVWVQLDQNVRSLENRRSYGGCPARGGQSAFSPVPERPAIRRRLRAFARPDRGCLRPNDRRGSRRQEYHHEDRSAGAPPAR